MQATNSEGNVETRVGGSKAAPLTMYQLEAAGIQWLVSLNGNFEWQM